MKRAARVGIAARGVAFLVLAYLVARIASGALGANTPKKAASGPGVAQAIAAQTGGRVAVFVLGAGLSCFALFCVLDAVLHHDGESDAKRWAARLRAAQRAVVYGLFSGYAFYTAVNGQSETGKSRHEQTRDKHLTAHVLAWPAGWLWVGLAGAVLLIAAAVLAAEAVRRSFMKHVSEERMGRRSRQLTLVLGTVGYLGRAAMFGIAGWFVISAAVEDDPQHGQGLDGSIREFADAAGGAVLLYVVAAALVAFGAYLMFEARFRKI